VTDLSPLILDVLPFALASMVSPVPLIIVMTLLSTSASAHRVVLFATTYIVVFAAISLAFGSIAAAVGKPSAVSVGIDLVLGVILIYVSARCAVRTLHGRLILPRWEPVL